MRVFVHSPASAKGSEWPVNGMGWAHWAVVNCSSIFQIPHEVVVDIRGCLAPLEATSLCFLLVEPNLEAICVIFSSLSSSCPVYRRALLPKVPKVQLKKHAVMLRIKLSGVSVQTYFSPSLRITLLPSIRLALEQGFRFGEGFFLRPETRKEEKCSRNCLPKSFAFLPFFPPHRILGHGSASIRTGFCKLFGQEATIGDTNGKRSEESTVEESQEERLMKKFGNF